MDFADGFALISGTRLPSRAGLRLRTFYSFPFPTYFKLVANSCVYSRISDIFVAR